MRFIATLIGALCFSQLVGCAAYSLNPLQTDDVVITDATLAGTWKPASPDEAGIQSMVVELLPNKQYDIRITMGEPKDAPQVLTLAGVLVQLGEYRFMNISSANEIDEQQCAQCGILAIPVNLICLVQHEGDSLDLGMLGEAWVKTLLEEDPGAIANIKTDAGAYLLTATAKELQTFCKKHAETKEAFAAGLPFTRVATPVAPAPAPVAPAPLPAPTPQPDR